jgi:hypothetical protein
MSDKLGRVREVIFDSSIKKNIIDKLMWWKRGDNVSNMMTSKFGIVFIKFDSMEEMLTKTEQLQELIHVEVD